MLDQLPLEVVHYILDYLLILRYEKKDSLGMPLTGFVNLHSWNEITNCSDLLALAHTCKRLKLIVYPVIFKTWAHVSEPYFGGWREKDVTKTSNPLFFPSYKACRRTELFFLPRIPSIYYFKSSPECLFSLSNATFKPQFYIVGSDMSLVFLMKILSTLMKTLSLSSNF